MAEEAETKALSTDIPAAAFLMPASCGPDMDALFCDSKDSLLLLQSGQTTLMQVTDHFHVQGPVHCSALSSTGHLAVAWLSGALAIIEVKRDAQDKSGLKDLFWTHVDGLSALAWRPQGLLVAAMRSIYHCALADEEMIIFCELPDVIELIAVSARSGIIGAATAGDLYVISDTGVVLAQTPLSVPPLRMGVAKKMVILLNSDNMLEVWSFKDKALSRTKMIALPQPPEAGLSTRCITLVATMSDNAVFLFDSAYENAFGLCIASDAVPLYSLRAINLGLASSVYIGSQPADTTQPVLCFALANSAGGFNLYRVAYHQMFSNGRSEETETLKESGAEAFVSETKENVTIEALLAHFEEELMAKLCQAVGDAERKVAEVVKIEAEKSTGMLEEAIASKIKSQLSMDVVRSFRDLMMQTLTKMANFLSSFNEDQRSVNAEADIPALLAASFELHIRSANEVRDMIERVRRLRNTAYACSKEPILSVLKQQKNLLGVIEHIEGRLDVLEKAFEDKREKQFL